MTDASFETSSRYQILFDDSMVWRRIGSQDRTSHRVVHIRPCFTEPAREAFSVHVQRFEVVGRRRRVKELGDGFSMDAARFLKEFETFGETVPGTPASAD